MSSPAKVRKVSKEIEDLSESLDETEINTASNIPGVPSRDNLGDMSNECWNCGARFFEDEVIGKQMNAIDFCCKSGTMELPEPFDGKLLGVLSMFKEPIGGNYAVPDNLKFTGKLEGEAKWSPNAFKDKDGQPVSPAEYFRYLSMLKITRNYLQNSLLLSRKVFMDVWALIDQDSLESHDLLPLTHQGSYRNLHEELLATRALFAELGDPHWSITFTCNGQWPEIQDNLVKDQGPHDRPDLIARVFKMKVDRMMYHLVDRELLGKVKAYAFSYEWQKRGLPHIHLLLTMEVKPSPEDIARLSWTKKPDENDKALFDTVKKRMLVKEKTNEKKNGWTVAAYNPDLLRIFDAAINVKPCHENSVRYPHKGSNKNAYDEWKKRKNEDGFNEIEHYLENRHFCAPEACHRLFGFPIFERSHEVHLEVLPIHFPSDDGQEERTQLTVYLKMNSELTDQLSYIRFPSKYAWNGEEWLKRIETNDRLVRGGKIEMSADEELGALRLLLMHTSTATSFEDLRTNGIWLNETFKRTAQFRGYYTKKEYEE